MAERINSYRDLRIYQMANQMALPSSDSPIPPITDSPIRFTEGSGS
ncbi:MAG: hypothetical protein AB7P69_17670 [Candidatus Binatia bacterium]